MLLGLSIISHIEIIGLEKGKAKKSGLKRKKNWRLLKAVKQSKSQRKT